MTRSFLRSLSFITCALLIAGCSVSRMSSHIPVVAVQPQVPTELKAEGTVFFAQEANIAPQREGIVLTLKAKQGDRVGKGQVLATLQSDRTQQELSALLAFKERELAIVRDQQATEEALITKVKHDVIEYARKQQALDVQDTKALLKKTQEEMAGIARQGEQLQQNTENAVFDFLEAATEMFYTRSDGLANLKYYDSTDFYRRPEAFYPYTAEMQAFEQHLIDLHHDVTSLAEEGDVRGMLVQAGEVGKEARQLAGRISSSPTLPADRVTQLQTRLGASVDRLLSLSTQLQENEGRLQVLRAEEDRLALKSQQSFTPAPSEPRLRERSPALIEAEIDRIRKQIGGGTIIKAPFSGVITQKFVNIGDSVDLSRPLFILMDDTAKFIRFTVALEVFPHVRIGMPIAFTPVYAPRDRMHATVRWIGQTVDPQTGSVRVEAAIASREESPRILSQIPVTVYLPLAADAGVLEVPTKALEVSGKPGIVWVVDGRGRAEPRVVHARYSQGRFTYIDEGLTESDRVIINAAIPLEPLLSVAVKTSS